MQLRTYFVQLRAFKERKRLEQEKQERLDEGIRLFFTVF